MKMTLVLLLCVTLMLANLNVVAGQTFQYSRGWTNGRKRSDDSSRGVQAAVVARRLFPFVSWPGGANRLAELAAALDSPATNAAAAADCRYTKSCPESDERSTISERDLVGNFDIPLLTNEFDHRASD